MVGPQDDWRRPLGSTGLTVTALGLGAGPLGSLPQLHGVEVPAATGIAVARAALTSPIGWLDTANGYSGGESERRIGAAIAELGGLPADTWVATKVDAIDGDYSGERIRASVRESRERLGLAELPLVYLHDPEFHDFATLTAPGGAVDTLMQLRADGEIGHVGLAGGNVHAMTDFLTLPEGSGDFEVLLVHNRWTLVDRSATELIGLARSRGIAVVNAAIYGGGLLADASRTTYAYRAAAPEVLDAVAAMRRSCDRYGTDLATVALQTSLADAAVTSTIVGTSRPERVAELLDAAAGSLPDGLADELAELTPPRHTWLDHR